MSGWDYRKAGVDVEAGYEAVRLMKPHAAKTFIPGVLTGLGGFGGCFEIPKGYDEPVLVSGTDGVGTKLKIAFLMDKHHTVGIDCVAMCVNDIICQGAKPLFFLDYIGTGKLNPAQVAAVVEGVSEGCMQAECALIGGETAELSGIYQPEDYDLVGFTVGIVEKARIITGAAVRAGDVLVGLASSGLHSNGFSLARKLALEVSGHQIHDYIPVLNASLGEALLTPTRIYVKPVCAALKDFTVKGMANVTGGGWIENIPRLLGGQENLKVVMHTGAAPVLPIFRLLQQWGQVSDHDMYNTFNMGVGFVMAVSPEEADGLIAALAQWGETAYRVGTVEERRPGEEPITLV